MENILSFIQNYGVGTLCVAYIIYFQNTTMKEMLQTLQSINSRLTIIETKLEEKEK